ncbi:MAG: hypothetical protein WCN81_16820 [Actinomycetes bacterium]
MLAILVGNSLRLLREAMGEQAREQAEQIAPVLSAALTAPLAAYDYATVQAVLDESHAIRGIDYLAVFDSTGSIVATSGWPRDKPLPRVDTSFTLDDDDDPPRYDLALPIKLAGQKLGTLQFGLDLSRIIVARNNLITQGMLIAGGELLLSACLLTLLGLLITRQLSLLTTASIEVAQGNLTPAPVKTASLAERATKRAAVCRSSSGRGSSSLSLTGASWDGAAGLPRLYASSGGGDGDDAGRRDGRAGGG